MSAGCTYQRVGRLRSEHTLAADDDLATVGRRLLDGRRDSVERPAVDQRADERAVGQGVADRYRRVRLGQALDQLVADRPVGDQTAQARAALARRADSGEGDAAHRQLEVGAGRDDGCVVAAELEDQRGRTGRRPPGRRPGPCRVDPVADTMATAS